MTKDIIIIAVLLLVVALASIYVYKVKKSGKKCIGCPDRCSCNSQNACTLFNSENE